jgi:WD40 repeat protein
MKLLQRLNLPDRPLRVLWLPAGDGLLLGTLKGLCCWQGEAQSWSGSLKGIRTLALAPDGVTAWAGGLSHEPGLEQWNLTDGSHLPCAAPPAGTVSALAPDAEKQRVYFGSDQGEIGWWNLLTGQISYLPLSLGQPVAQLALDAAGRYLAWIEESVSGAMVYVWDLAHQQGLLTYPLKHPGRLLRFDRETLIWGECGKHIQLYRLPLQPGPPPPKTRIPQTECRLHRRPVMTLALSADQQLAASASTHNETKLLLWDAPSGQLLDEYDDAGTPTDLAFSPDGSQLAIASGQEVQIVSLT